jgi:hypothetical protein
LQKKVEENPDEKFPINEIEDVSRGQVIIKSAVDLKKFINNFIDNNNILFWIISLFFWYIFSVILIKFLKIDIYKIIIGIGTFSLALAFAGNDLVNFIGVPIAALESYNGWVTSGISECEPLRR